MPETFDHDGYTEGREAYLVRLGQDMEGESCDWPEEDCDY